ncbi:MAG: Baseplate J-like protein [bacterium ADurb.Bin429]|nr:MAG: Baseplate J-like protein [bacterium ADurb.Bin429]
MTATRGRLPYLNKDYTALREELLARIPQLTDRWTDFNASDLGVVLLELFAGVADMLAYYLDTQAAECYLPTARQRQHVIDLCALINYRLHGPLAATTRVRFTLAEPATALITIPARTVCRAQGEDGPIPFETLSACTIFPGLQEGEVDAWQGERSTLLYTGTGLPAQRLPLTHDGIAHGSVEITSGGLAWTAVEHFVDSSPTDRHFRVETDGLGGTAVVFGDGRTGVNPTTGQSLTISYLVTLGPGGNLAPHRITELPSPPLVNGVPVSVQVDNPIPATGGADEETMAHARQWAPVVLRSTWKAVTRADYLALCMSFPGVAKARIVDLNTDASMRVYAVRVCIAPAGGGLPSPALKAELYAFLETRRLVTVEVTIEDPVYRPIPVTATLYCTPDQSPDTVRLRAQQVLTEAFAFDRQEFGQAVYQSDLIVLLDGVPGVSHVTLHAPGADVLLLPHEIATLGAVSLHVVGVA